MANSHFSRRENEQWPAYALRMYKYFKGKRHYGYSRALLWLAAGLLTPSLIDVVLTLIGSTERVIQEADCGQVPILNMTSILGGTCIVASIAIFCIFEFREQQVVRSLANEGAISLAWDGDWTFQAAADYLANRGKTTIRFSGFSTEELHVTIRNTATIEYPSIYDALEALHTLTNEEISTYSVLQRKNYIELRVEE